MHRTSVALASVLLLAACSSNGDQNGEDSSGPPPAEGGAEAANGGDAALDEPFGRACELGKPCPDDPQGYPNLCVAPEGATEGKGFCTRTCNAQAGGPECYGVPNGQWAACILGNKNDGGPETNFCAFLCQSPKGEWTCPPTQSCGEVKDGYALCRP